MMRVVSIFDRLLIATAFGFLFALTFAWTWRLLAVAVIIWTVMALVG